MSNLKFRTNAKVESLVGRELITNNIIAIFELVKNSYDAGATKVEIKFIDFLPSNSNKELSTQNSLIQIIDNGKGMTFKEIDQYWMELGTPYKEKNKFSEVRLRQRELDRIAKRTVNGEKGIGRFGVDKIGSRLKLIAVSEDRKEKTTVNFDWSKFDNRDKLLEEIECEYEKNQVSSSDDSGLTLEISKLRDKWFEKDFNRLKRSLSKFLSPIPVEQDEFRILFTYVYEEDGERIEDTEEIMNDSFDYLKTKIYAELGTDGLLYYQIEDLGEVVEEQESYYFDNGSSFGAARLEIYYVDPNDKRIFTSKMGMRTSDYGNIKIFKDNFRIMPYGEPNNDWLEIDKEHAQGFFRTFGTRDLVGHVLFSHDPQNGNQVLKEATDRVGLIEDVAEFEDLKKFVWFLIRVLQNYVFNKIKKDAKESTKVLITETDGLKRDATNVLHSFKSMIDKVEIPDSERQQIIQEFEITSQDFIKSIDTVEKATEEIEKKIKVISQMTNKEGILYEMLHTIKNKLTIIESQIKGFELEIELAGLEVSTTELKTAFRDIHKLVVGSLDKVNASKLKTDIVSINNLIEESLNSQRMYLNDQDISLDKDISKSTDVKIRCIPESIKSVLENLMSNSVKALEGIVLKKVFVSTNVVGNIVEIYFSDNGIGVPKNKERLLFSLWGSGTAGTGIGLASSKDIIEEHKGELAYVDLFDENISTTFLIKLPIHSK
ncbi:sensor histidine kinase [Bacillus toyonensis]|uniref:sensor histidine kinase n=1 Tax=Bacillus toyonensis TaxID=155322 RepID=UPI0015541E6C|nr:sensor histidine kinase [Bacillus toyonensis]